MLSCYRLVTHVETTAQKYSMYTLIAAGIMHELVK